MLCELCRSRPATARVQFTSGNKTRVMNLCEVCLEEVQFEQSFADFFGGFGPGPSEIERVPIDELLAERAKKVLEEAAKKALSQKVRQVDTEHLLWALTNDDVATEVLKELDINPEKLANQIEEQFEEGSYEGDQVDFTPRAKQVIQLAYQEAMDLGHKYIGTEHLLLALIREGEGLAAQLLKKLAVNHTSARQAVIRVVGEGGKKGGKIQKSRTPTLDKYGRDLIVMAREGKIDPVIGRSAEISRVIQILSRRKKNNPVLIGEPGVGKTAIVEGLAYRIAVNNIPDILKGKRVVSLDLGAMIAGTKYRGEFEERAKKVIEEVVRSEREVILFVDELHTVVGAGATEGQMDLSNMIKPFLARGELQLIGATTLDEYKKYIEKDAALERRFQPVLVKEPTVEQTVEILKGIRDKYEAHHKIKITDDALLAAAELSEKFIRDRFQPDKAIDVVDEAASRLRIETMSEPEELHDKKRRLEELEREREALVRAKKYKEAAELKQQAEKLKEEIAPLEDLWQKKKGKGVPQLGFDQVAEVVSQITGIPVAQLKEEEKDKLIHLEKLLHQRIVAQDEAVNAVSEAIRRARVGLKDPNRPIASFIFLGPTGVGKTELAKALAEYVFGSEKNMIRLDMSEYMEKHSVSKLIGSPPGYVGYEEGGQLTEVIRKNPYSLILLDEIEKAHADVLNILLQILEDGRLTDAKGKIVDFKNTIIIATSNIGADMVLDKLKSYSDAGESDVNSVVEFRNAWEDVKEKLMEELKKTFKPEFLNRIDEIIVFHPLKRRHLRDIVTLQLKQVKKLLQAQGIKLQISEEAIDKILEEGYAPEFGARPLRRTIQKMVENPLSSMILKGQFIKGDTVKVDVKDGKIEFGKSKIKRKILSKC